MGGETFGIIGITFFLGKKFFSETQKRNFWKNNILAKKNFSRGEQKIFSWGVRHFPQRVFTLMEPNNPRQKILFGGTILKTRGENIFQSSEVLSHTTGGKNFEAPIKLWGYHMKGHTQKVCSSNFYAGVIYIIKRGVYSRGKSTGYIPERTKVPKVTGEPPDSCVHRATLHLGDTTQRFFGEATKCFNQIFPTGGGKIIILRSSAVKRG